MLLFGILFVAHPIFIGVLAQTSRNQIGVLWAFITLLLNIAISVFLDAALYTARVNHPERLLERGYSEAAEEITFIIFVLVPSTLILLIALFTLPRRSAQLVKVAPPDAEPVLATKVCPMCAETVKSAAKVCRFCGHHFEEAQPAPAAIDPNVAERGAYLGVQFTQFVDGSVTAFINDEVMTWPSPDKFRYYVYATFGEDGRRA